MNLGALNKYETKEAYDVGASIRNVPLSVTLKDKIKYHQEQILKIEQTLNLLEVNKDIEKLMFLLTEIH